MHKDEQPVYMDNDPRFMLPWGKPKAPDGQLQISQLEWFVLKMLVLAIAVLIGVSPAVIIC